MRVRSLEIPKRLEWDASTLSDIYGKFVAEPFERGYATTIGNSLRRILLSSIEGAAVTSVRIDGVLHEFSTIPGVVEDVTDIILNLKQLRLKLRGSTSKILRLEAEGEREIKARDIITDSDTEILTPDLHIATLTKDGHLVMEIEVDRGRGYITAEKNKREDQPIGVIPVDSFFSPVQKVNFDVENTRVGQIIDYERLILEIWTDGSVKPQDALTQAAIILRDHLTGFISYEEKAEEEKQEEKREEIDEKRINLQNALDRTVDELELSVRAYNCLKNANIKTLRDLVQKTDADLLKTRNFGRKSLNEIKEILEQMGLSLGMKLDDLESGKAPAKDKKPEIASSSKQ